MLLSRLKHELKTVIVTETSNACKRKRFHSLKKTVFTGIIFNKILRQAG
jgi:hypothetical protein